uniref:Fanconi anaemia group A protein N-terminal domain-containing protein n=1 Tax=Monopterus albus TaxID=43700 RepID=A0A3Q3IM50_MONAL
MEYISLAKTRLADLKESVEDMGLYEDVSGTDGTPVQPQCQAVQDVERAVNLFESTGRISATVMEASIFRRPYFLTRFLPALLTPRVVSTFTLHSHIDMWGMPHKKMSQTSTSYIYTSSLVFPFQLPVKAGARMGFIEALKKADKIPAAQYSSYVESCQRQRQQDSRVVCLDTNDDPLEVLEVQLQKFTQLVVDGNDGEMSAQLSRVSHTLSVVLPGSPDEPIEPTVIKLHIDTPVSPELHVRVVDMILRNFCQCVLDASRANPPNKQSLWASRFVSVLHGNSQLLSSLVHRLWDLFHNQGSFLSSVHLLGLAAFVVHLHASMSHSPLVQLVPPLLSKPVPVGEVLSLALDCSTHANMLFCVRLCVAAVCYGICKGDSLPPQQQQVYIFSGLYKKLVYLIPRLLPEARRTPISAEGLGDGHQEQNLPGLWSSATNTNGTWRKAAWSLWRHAAFRQLEHTSQYRLLFSEWLVNEFRVQRSEDALTDPERQEYQQWACLELYLPRPEEQGGCGGDMKSLCSHLLGAIMDQQLTNQSLDKPDHRVPDTGTCLPDILSRLQEVVYEMEVTDGWKGRTDACDFLFELLSQRCSSGVSSAAPSVSSELSLQHTVNTWNRVLLALPAVLFVKVKAEGGRCTLDCTKLIEHINQHQRKVCSPAGVLSCHVTAHFLRGMLCASAQCSCPREGFNQAWSEISLCCPLLLTSTVHWWEHLSPVLLTLWSRLCDEEPLPEHLQLLTEALHWAHSLDKALLSPPAPALLLAASLHCAWRDCRGDSRGFGAVLTILRPEGPTEYRQVLVFLLFLGVNDYLSALLYPQERSCHKARAFCTELLSVLLDSADWLLIFQSNKQGVYQSVTMVTSDEFTRLMPWAFYNLLLQQSAELLHRAVCCPGFLHTAVLCYISLLQLFLDGHTPALTADSSEQQVEPSQILSATKQFLLRVISQSSPTALSSSQLRELETQCADLDPEVTTALSVHLDPHSLSPEMDFL